jgi:hypothetical protein
MSARLLSEAEPPADGGSAIPVGLGTMLGAFGTTILGVAALVSAVLGGDHTAETVGALASAAIVLVATIAGRFAQAYAIYRNPPTPPAPSAPVGTTYQPAPTSDDVGSLNDPLATTRRRSRPPSRP